MINFMIPNFEIFGKTFSAYMILALAGALAALYFTYKTAKKNGLDELKMLNAMLFSAIGVLVGAHLMYGITMYDKFLYFITHLYEISSFTNLFERLMPIFGGAVFYGGLLGGLLVGLICYRKMKLTKPYVDIGACAIPLFHFFGRIGCFLSGCCYGIESSFGFVYHHALDAAINDVMRFPIQLVEALFNLLLFLVLLRLLKEKKLQGKLLLVYLIAYPIFRFFAEFLRGDGIRGFVGPLSTSQVISVLIIIGTVIYMVVERRKGTNNLKA